MRPLEIVLLIAILVFAWWSATTGRPRRTVADLFGIVGVGAAGAAQFVIEGFRWQLVPLYLAAVIVVVVSVWDLLSPVDDDFNRGRSVRSAVWATVGLAIVASVPVALPVVDVPGEPAGLVGTVSYVASDAGRIEVYGDDPSSSRELAVQVWYPAATVEGVERADWVDNLQVLAPTASEYLGFPPFFLDHLELTATNSFQTAPAQDGSFPVVVYSHGWGGFRSVALNQMEALAGQGFVVVAIDHTYAALSTTLSDGEARRIDLDALPSQDAVTPEEYEAARELLSLTFTEDIWFVLDELEIIDQGGVPSLSPLAGHLDLDRIGFLGHSTGGGAALAACEGDRRCDAVLGQDPWLEPLRPDVIETGISKPFLAVRSEEWLTRPNDALVMSLVASSGPDATLAYLVGTVHRDFTMLPAISPLAGLAGLSGSLDAERTFEAVDAINLAFFDEHLRSGPSHETRLAGFTEVVFGE